jgi:hypothetical protein
VKKALLLPLLAVALLWGTCSAGVFAADAPKPMKPLAVVSLASYDEMLADAAYIGRLAGSPDVAAMIESTLKLFTQGEAPACLDKTLPWGIVVQTDGNGVSGYGFLPVTDAKKLLSALEPMIGPMKDMGDGVQQVQKNGPPVYLKAKDGWLFISPSIALMGQLPADPAVVLGELHKQYHVAVRLYPTNVPEQHRAMALAAIKASADAAGGSQETNAAQQALHVKLREEMVRSVVTVLDDLDQVSLGWKLDRQAETTFLELSLTAKEGTETAKQMAVLQDAKTDFAGFRLPGAALSGNWVGRMPEREITTANSVVAYIRAEGLKGIEKANKPDEETKLAKELLGDALDLVEQTVKSGRIDGGMAVLLDPEAVTLLVGGYVANDGRIERIARKVTDIARQQNPTIAGWIKLNVEEFKGVTLHTMSIPIPENAKDRQKVVQLIGDKVEVVVGTGKDRVYAAAGRDAMKNLKEVIEKSAAEAGKPVPPVQFSLAVTPIARFMAAVGKESDRPKAAWVAGELAKLAPNDHVNLVASAIPRGVKYRLEIEGGILKTLGKAAAGKQR